jgi:hypothetical protein
MHVNAAHDFIHRVNGGGATERTQLTWLCLAAQRNQAKHKRVATKNV